MGNSMNTEKISFIRAYGSTKASIACKDLKETRIETFHLKSTKEVLLTALGICSALQAAVNVVLTISESKSGKELLSQKVNLIMGNDDHITSYYPLDKKVTLEKGVFYKFSLEITGGVTYSYEQIHDYVPNQEVIFQISKELPTSSDLPGSSKSSDKDHQPSPYMGRGHHTMKKIQLNSFNIVTGMQYESVITFREMCWSWD